MISAYSTVKTLHLERKEHDIRLVLIWTIGLIALFHLIGLGVYPLLGTTEGRYAEMARKMVLSGQFLVPMFTETEPFWGKPPLSIWLSAFSMKLFGVNEFAVRLPSWLASFCTGLLVVRLLQPNVRAALIAFLLWISSYLGYVAFGKVHTDAILTFSVTLALVGLYIGHHNHRLFWHLAGFTGIGLGLLAKGPVVLVYVGLPWFIWIVLQKQLFQYIKSLRVWAGFLLSLAIALPWYIAAENAYPGFLEYFLLGEHFQRFLDPGWLGDLYGAGHEELPGTILFFLAESLLPWSLLLPLLYVFRKKRRLYANSAPTSYLLAWACSPVIFFCASANVVPNYVMPTLPAWFSLIALALIPFHYKRRQVWLLALFACLFPLVKLVQNVNADWTYDEPRNQRSLVLAFIENRSGTKAFYFAGKRLYTAEFYLDDIRYATDQGSLPNHSPYVMAMRSGREPFPKPTWCQELSSVNDYRIFDCDPT